MGCGKGPGRVGPPNIILIIGDDHGYRDFGFMGSDVALTPRLDAMAAEATVFTHGYATASVGKWHLGPRGYAPTDQGFDFSIAGNARGIPPSYFWPYEFVNLQGRKFGISSLRKGGQEGEYLTDRLTDEAIAWLDAHSGA